MSDRFPPCRRHLQVHCRWRRPSPPSSCP
ncbi:hypothetical protein CAEBREN_08520 [Caenorhabditis brenneri]|uniref:Uncharacterized protein n=1 Tax=Caenorhabditis brenneri TaxID=135651 RepID=G0P3T6_CAEBE|nr:hypothetical protein CAEBREN_08520 [Caenorhabditis brenneri]